MADAFPLQWPAGWPRTPIGMQRRAPYKITPDRATSDLIHSLKLLGALHGSIVVSSNVPVRRDGMPYANGAPPADTGVAVYWGTSSHGERVMACDKWLLVHENIRALGKAVEGLRAIDRAGASQILERAYTAFGALPPAANVAPKRPWWEVLGFPEALIGALSAAVTDARFRELAKRIHPDHGGSAQAMAELNDAAREAREHYARGAA